MAVKTFAPNLDIIAPWRTWDIKSREDEIEYAEARNIPLKINREKTTVRIKIYGT